MITSKELLVCVVAIIFLAFSNSFTNLPLLLTSLVMFIIIFAVYVFSKKAMAYYVDSETEEKIWTIQRYGFREHQYYKNPVPIGLLISFLLSVMSFGYIKWLAVTETEIRPTPARAARKHDFYSFAELTEWHIAIICAAGMVALLLLAFVAYLLNVPELGKLAIYFAVFNMVPLGKTDGTKIFFGSLILYFTMLTIVLIALGYALLLI